MVTAPLSEFTLYGDLSSHNTQWITAHQGVKYCRTPHQSELKSAAIPEFLLTICAMPIVTAIAVQKSTAFPA